MVDSATILMATSNAGKLREARAVLADLAVRVAALSDHPSMPVPVEDGETFEQNAVKKALHYARLTGCWTLADDSGLEVDALGGIPGVHSARYAGRPGDDRANNAKLIAALAGVPRERRTARFRCVVALASASGVRATAAGTLEGLIVDEPAGHGGFGYDPHFFVPGYGMTVAQMAPQQKNEISHRGQALRAIRCEIERVSGAR